MKKLILIFVFLVAALNSFGQDYLIYDVANDTITIETIYGANILVTVIL